MKIAHIFWSFTVGGAETMLVDIMNKQAEQNEVELIIINNNYNKKLLTDINNRVRIKHLKRKPGSRNPSFILLLNFHLLINKFDIIHCHNYNIDKVILKTFHSKLILTVHGFNTPITPNNNYKIIVAISKSIKKDLENKGIKYVTTIYNGINTSNISRKEKFNKTIAIASIGRLSHEIKGQDKLIVATSLLVDSGINATLDLIGAGPSESYLRKLTKELGIDNIVTFHGIMSRAELYRIIRNYDIIVQPSVHEGFGLAAIEAMVAKVPLLISRASGLLEVSENGKYAIVIDDESPEGINRSLNLIINKLQSSQEHVKVELNEAENHAINNFDINYTVEKYYVTYKRLMTLTT